MQGEGNKKNEASIMKQEEGNITEARRRREVNKKESRGRKQEEGSKHKEARRMKQ